MAFHVIINPVLTLESPPEIEFFEGCLSLPGFVALVPRARKVKVECLDEHGQAKVIRASGWYARILQHEIDHLSGALYVDRMRSVSLCTLDNFTPPLEGKDGGRGEEAAGVAGAAHLGTARRPWWTLDR